MVSLTCCLIKQRGSFYVFIGTSLVNSVMENLFLQKAGNVQSRWATRSFPRRTLIHGVNVWLIDELIIRVFRINTSAIYLKTSRFIPHYMFRQLCDHHQVQHKKSTFHAVKNKLYTWVKAFKNYEFCQNQLNFCMRVYMYFIHVYNSLFNESQCWF